ncbi:CASP-like protein PIMP1 isoform X2 [Nicotiana tomentosiformis]|uniref:CASP-like protein PIMP1 isoform X2 n=1 Tax=Nicotiana tomentosiformis TaxID=4098 RepID=UPI00388C96FE
MGCLVIVNLLLRILSLCCLATSITILTTASSDMTVSSLFHKDVEVKFGFSDFYAYRYMLACAAAGFVYSLLQTVFAIIQVKTGDCICDKLIHFDVYADKIQVHFTSLDVSELPAHGDFEVYLPASADS